MTNQKEAKMKKVQMAYGWVNKSGYIVATSLPQRFKVLDIKEYGGEVVEIEISRPIRKPKK